MGKILLTASIFLLICLGLQAASSQGYMGTVSTGTGIIPPISVGSGTIAGASVGATAVQDNLTGTWSLDLKDFLIRHLDLTVFQNRDVIFGNGEMAAAGDLWKVAVSGSAASGRTILFVNSLEGHEIYKLDLSSSGTSLSGKYNAYTSAGTTWSGTATGNIALDADQSTPTQLGGGVSPAASPGAYVGSAAEPFADQKTIVKRSFSATYDGMTAGGGETAISSGQS